MATEKKMMSTKEALEQIFSLIKPTIVAGLVSLGYRIIEKYSYEPNTEGIITKRKARRIRFLTKLKLRYLKKHKYIEHVFGMDGYYEGLNKKMNGNGLQLCDTGTDRTDN